MIHPFEKLIRLPGLFLLFLMVAWQPVFAQEDVRKIVGRNVVHTVKSGESMLTVAQRYGLAVDHLAFANGFSPLTVDLPPGEQLIVPGERVLPKNPPKNGLVLNLPERGLYLFRNGQFDRFVPVSIGDEKGFLETGLAFFRGFFVERKGCRELGDFSIEIFKVENACLPGVAPHIVE